MKKIVRGVKSSKRPIRGGRANKSREGSGKPEETNLVKQIERIQPGG